jgi:hypothetical protein
MPLSAHLPPAVTVLLKRVQWLDVIVALMVFSGLALMLFQFFYYAYGWLLAAIPTAILDLKESNERADQNARNRAADQSRRIR